MRIQTALVPLIAVIVLFASSFAGSALIVHAGPTSGGCGTTYEHTYDLQPNPFPPNSPGFNAWGSLYGQNQTTESTYEYASIDSDSGGDCGTAPSGAPTANIILVPSSVDSGGSSLLSWASTNSTSCTGVNFSTGGALGGTVTVSPQDTTVYTVTCTNGSANASASATLTVNPPPAPTVTLTANPGNVHSGSSSTLTWSSANALFCTGSGFQTGGNLSGSVSTGPLTATTNYSITCTGKGGSSSSSSSGGSAATSGTWQLSSSEITDLACPLTDVNKVYDGVPDCPVVPPAGTSCTTNGDTCKVNRAVGCNISTRTFSCVGASSGSPGVTTTTTAPAPTASAYATVRVTPPFAISCVPSSTTAAPGTPITWTATPTGGSGSFTYSWSGTDTLSGASASVAKTYLTGGVKTASVTVTDTGSSGTPGSSTTTNTPPAGGAFALSGGMQCSGGTLVARSSDTQDGVGFTGGAGDAMSAECQNIMGSGNCCSVTVSELVGPDGQPVHTRYSYASYSGVTSLVQKDSYSTGVSGSNHTNYNFFAGMTSANGSTGGSSTTVTPPTAGIPASSLTTSCNTFICSGDACTNPPPVIPSGGGGGTGGGTGGGGGGTGGGTAGASSLSALLTASPTTVVYGAPSILSWTSAHAVSCDGGNFATGGHTAGTISVNPVATMLYSLTCTDASGNHAYSTATVSVISPTLSIAGSPQLVRPGDSATITWSVSGHVDACSVSGPGLSSLAVSGSQAVVIHSESVFTLSCTAGALHSQVSTAVKILPTFQEK